MGQVQNCGMSATNNKLGKMKTTFNVLLAVLVALLLAGCRKPLPSDAANWSKPEVVSKTSDSLGSSFAVHKGKNGLVAINTDTKALAISLLKEDGKSWKETIGSGIDSMFFSCDPGSSCCVASSGATIGNTLKVDFSIGSISTLGDFTVSTRQTWQADKDVIFGKTEPGVSFGGLNNQPVPQIFSGGMVSDNTIYIPYCIRGETKEGKMIMASKGPFDNGVIYSLDSGHTWQRQHISSSASADPFVCKTTGYYYYIAGNSDENELWFARKPEDKSDWSAPQPLSKHLKLTGFQPISCTTEGDTVHVCWLDRRHEKERANPVYPWRGNYEIVYSQRKDSGSGWSKEVILSEGLFYSFHPSLSVEDDRIVVAWAGVQSAPDGHSHWSPNDIYFVTSQDRGQTWSRPVRVTDNIKSGITAGTPQVALQNGVIHLFYAQGKLNFKEAAAGMRLLNQPPWPIYYQQRPFPSGNP